MIEITIFPQEDGTWNFQVYDNFKGKMLHRSFFVPDFETLMKLVRQWS